MLFNSFAFIFGFLPPVFGLFFVLAKHSRHLAGLWLAAASIFFYGWWNPAFVTLLLASIVFNYGAGYLIGHRHGSERGRSLLTGAIAVNLAVLGLFKYANFFIATIDSAGGTIAPLDIVMPIGISFFTFTQIAFLVDVYRGIAKEYNFVHYLLFVTWFPHLIAGPVLHHKQMMPQFAHAETYRFDPTAVAVGLTLFIVGLFKKVILADQFALYANPIFDAAASGSGPALAEAWTGALAYTLQIYFDFSGYSDMAIGLSRLFNVKLPLNFNSPYKSENIIEFWRRWHMTLSAFLRDYLYFPLGGNRKGPLRRQVNLMTTMLLGGLWHGAGWNFIVWGGLHGLYLIINHGWQGLAGHWHHHPGPWRRRFAVALTFLAVTIAWVPFRAANLEATINLLRGMAGLNGLSLPYSLAGSALGALGDFVSFDGLLPISAVKLQDLLIWFPLGFAIVWGLPNSQQWLAEFSPAWNEVPRAAGLVWRPTRGYAVVFAGLFVTCLLNLDRVTQFLYFQF